jgi:hypothetical protein
MKRLKFLGGALMVLLAACQSKSERVKSAIPGTYAKSAAGEYSSAEDTLILSQVSDNNYLIIRHTAYQVIRNGKALPEQHRSEKLAGTWDEQRQVLVETAKGRQLTFDPAKGLLVVNGKGVYERVK